MANSKAKGPVKALANKRGRIKAATNSKPKAGNVLSPKRVAVLERRFKIVNLRANGLSLKEIADELRLSVPTVSEDLKTVMEDTVLKTNEDAEVARKLQDMRLDKIVRSHLPIATEAHMEKVKTAGGKEVVVLQPPSTASAQIVLQAEQRRGKLLGLDLPETKRVEISGIREYVGVDLDKI